MFEKGILNFEKYGVGNSFLKMRLPNTKNEIVAINSYKGKVVLIDFWASWCAPCRKKHPELITLKETYKDANFDILSVSIDENKDPWLKVIKKDELVWTNVIDIYKKVYNKLNIMAIPLIILSMKTGFF